MVRSDQELIEAVLADLDDPDAWEDDPAPDDSVPGPLDAVITVRIDAATQEKLRDVAQRLGMKYTTLIRSWINERLSGPTDLIATRHRATELRRHAREADPASQSIINRFDRAVGEFKALVDALEHLREEHLESLERANEG